jgi:hypothetical protein
MLSPADTRRQSSQKNYLRASDDDNAPFSAREEKGEENKLIIPFDVGGRGGGGVVAWRLGEKATATVSMATATRFTLPLPVPLVFLDAEERELRKGIASLMSFVTS